MKLRNKKTGEIVSVSNIAVGMGDDGGWYNSIAELTEEWEDYEEPKKYWYIGDRGEIFPEIVENPGHIWHQARKEIGNYFETKEEAEKAVEKLKAWKRLKDKGFKFDGLTFSYWSRPCIEYTPGIECIEGVDYLRVDSQVEADLDLLFRAEE